MKERVKKLEVEPNASQDEFPTTEAAGPYGMARTRASLGPSIAGEDFVPQVLSESDGAVPGQGHSRAMAV